MSPFFIRAIRKTAHITNGITARAANFSQRVENKTSRILMGTDSSFQIVKTASIDQIYYGNVPYITPLHPALPHKGQKPTITLFLPTLDNNSFFGGTATAIIVAAIAAQKAQYDLRIVQTLKRGEASVENFLKASGISFSGKISTVDVSARKYNFYGYISIHPDDIFMASAWWDAYLISHLPLKRKFIYLIQDFEPIFYNNSDRYLLAQSTYNFDNYVALCNTKLMYDFMMDAGYKNVGNGAWFEPAVSHFEPSIKTKSHKKPRKLFLYGRPGVDRNLFFTGLNAIDNCFMKNQLDIAEWEIFMAGQNDIPDVQLNSGPIIKNLGKMSFPDYLAFVKSVDLTVSLMMAPHPNYPTLELASAGAAVVTTRYGLKKDLSNYSKNIFMADASVDDVSRAIKAASRISPEDRFRNAKSSNISADWNSIEDRVALVLEKLGL